jgi:hypothetical protein
LGARLTEWGKWNWPLLTEEAGGGGCGGVVMVVVVLVTSAGAAAAEAFVVGVPGKRRPLMLTVSRLLQWPHRTVTVLNRLLVGTLTCTHARLRLVKIFEIQITCWRAACAYGERSRAGVRSRTTRTVSQKWQCT